MIEDLNRRNQNPPEKDPGLERAAQRLHVIFSELGAAIEVSNDFRNGPPGDTRKGPPVFIQRHFRLQSMVSNGSCGAGSVKPPAAFGGGPQGLA
ncbi:hypothetical protein [Azospirillum ramasamyi]|uniref:Uncharacterized protein n=1 Tax=Azospirillum ramasamyi TaxID=682998 RepID=A0A2U9SCG3_9PROT|nr:hypothetical protein [Azospirillum ramasamyi]AWU95648.1 hypothetical protein DM194_15230 [Azospirillum ramasamyi]